MRFASLMAGLFGAALLAAPASAHVTPEERDESKVVHGDKVSALTPFMQTLTELRINTGEKMKMSDGEVNDKYILKRPADGNTFLNVEVRLVAEDGYEYHLSKSDIRLQLPGQDTPVYHPFDWFVNDTVLQDDEGHVTLGGKQAIVFTAEVPKKDMHHLVLYVGHLRVGEVAAMKPFPEVQQQSSD